MSEQFPRTQGDIEAAYAADQAYRNGAWLAFAVDGGMATEEQQVLLGGNFDDRALHDLGYDGTIAAEDERLFDPYSFLGSVARFTRGEVPSSSDVRRAELEKRHEFYTSPVVREPERLASKVPAEVPPNPENVVWQYFGKANDLAATFGTETQQLNSGAEVRFDGMGRAYVTTVIPEGKRLVIDSIPKGRKNNPDEPTPYMQVHVYENPNGYLVADKVRDDMVVGEKRPAAVARNNGYLSIDRDAPTSQSLYPSDDKKQEFRDPLHPDRKNVQLLKTTAEWTIDEHMYDRFEITVSTPDDAGREVRIQLGQSDALPGPIILRVVDDTDEELHPLLTI